MKNTPYYVFGILMIHFNYGNEAFWNLISTMEMIDFNFSIQNIKQGGP